MDSSSDESDHRGSSGLDDDIALGRMVKGRARVMNLESGGISGGMGGGGDHGALTGVGGEEVGGGENRSNDPRKQLLHGATMRNLLPPNMMNSEAASISPPPDKSGWYVCDRIERHTHAHTQGDG